MADQKETKENKAANPTQEVPQGKMDETPVDQSGGHALNSDIPVSGERHRRPIPVRKLRDMGERIPYGVAHSKMSAYEPPGKKGFWFNDVGGTLDRAVEGGWNFVKRKDVDKVGTGPEDNNASLGDMVSVIASPSSGMRAYYMLIDKELWKLDQEKKQEPVDRTEQAILDGTLENKMEPGKSYVPQGGINIKATAGGHPSNYKP